MRLIPSFVRKLFGTAGAPEVIAVAIADTTKVVTLLMTMPIATAVRDDIRSISVGSHSGQQKFDIVLGKALPALIELLSRSGLPVEPADVEDIARELVQAIYNDTMSMSAGKIARQILTIFGAL